MLAKVGACATNSNNKESVAADDQNMVDVSSSNTNSREISVFLLSYILCFVATSSLDTRDHE